MRPLLLGFFLLCGSTAGAACPATVSAVSAKADAVDQALTQLDGETFLTAMGQLSDAAACVDSPLPIELVGRLHRAHAVLAFTHGDDARTRSTLLAAHAVQPDTSFTRGTLPVGHPLIAELLTSSGANHTEALPKPGAGKLWIDGQRSLERPVDRSAVVQLIGSDGSGDFSAYLFPSDPTPNYAVAEGTGKKKGLKTLTMASGVSSALLFGGAALSRHDFLTYDYDPAFNTDVLDAKKSRTNLLATGGGLTAATALVAGGLSLRGTF